MLSIPTLPCLIDKRFETKLHEVMADPRSDDPPDQDKVVPFDEAASASSPGTRPEVSIRQLEYLVAIVDSPTWATAASEVGVSAPALSQGIAELERRLGVRLFRAEGRRRVVRSDVGPVIEQARRMLAAASDLGRWVDEYRGALRGGVRLGMIDIAAVSYYPDLVRDFRRDHPDVALRLTVTPSRPLIEQLRDGDLDLAVCVAPPEQPFGMIVSPLRRDPLHVIGPSGADADDMANWGPWVMFPEGSHSRRDTLRHLAALGASTRIVAESHQPEVLAEMVAMDIGWAVLPVPDPDALSHTVLGPVLFDRQLVLITRDDAIPSPARSALVDRFLDTTAARPAATVQSK